jgi:hypothetical protein
VHRILLLAVVLVTGCSSDPGDDDDSAVGLHQPAPSEPLISERCEQLCSDREAGGPDGGCPFEWRSGNCPLVCEDFAQFSQLTQDAFTYCVEHDPLCYQDISSCVWWNRYPDPISVSFVLNATGFDAYEGEAAVIALSPGANTFVYDNQQVSSGGFSATWTEEAFVGSTHLVLFYVDRDGDGDCDPAVDVPGTIYMEIGANYDAPVFTADLSGPGNFAEFVCDYI